MRNYEEFIKQIYEQKDISLSDKIIEHLKINGPLTRNKIVRSFESYPKTIIYNVLVKLQYHMFIKKFRDKKTKHIKFKLIEWEKLK